MSKYIIDIPKTVGMGKVGSVHYTYFDGIQCQTIILKNDEIEELNSDYINEHFGDLQDTAYQQGLEDGKKATWEAVRKVIHLPEGVVLDLFTDCYSSVCTVLQVFLKYEGSEVIEKLKAYEKKQSDKIKVGDEVEWDNDFTGDRFIVTRIFQPRNMKEQCDGIDDDGCVYHDVLIKDLEKTGRHFDIASILEEMRK